MSAILTTTNGQILTLNNNAIIAPPTDPILKIGVIRPDAEKVKTWGWDAYAVDDWELTIPAYSTSAQTIKASTALSNDTYTINYADYDYYIIEEMLSIPTYSISTIAKGRVEYWIGAYAFEVAEIPGHNFHTLIDPSKDYASRVAAIRATGVGYYSLYWSSATAVTPYSTGAYSVVQTAVAPTLGSGGVITINTPAVTVRGSTTYFVNTFFNAITDILYQWITELWRAPKSNLNLDGWGTKQALQHIITCIDTPTQTLT